MISRGPGFLAVIWLGSSPIPLPSASCLSVSVILCIAGQAYWRERGWGEGPNHMTARKPGPLYIINILWLYFSCSENCLCPGAASSIKLIKLMAKSLIEPIFEHCLILTELIISHHCSTRVVKQGDHQSKKTTLIEKVHTNPSKKTSVDPGNNLQCSGYCRLHILD